MASDKSEFGVALEKWQSFHNDGLFSDPVESKGVAVLLPFDYGGPYKGVESFEALRTEASKITDALHITGHNVTLAVNAKEHDFNQVMAEPSISSVIVIGHGCLSAVEMPDPIRRLDWADISRMATHLKTGRFLQRFCGGLHRDLNVPFGAFAMSSHSDVYAPVGQPFSPASTEDKENHKIERVIRTSTLDYDLVKTTFPRRKRGDSSPSTN